MAAVRADRALKRAGQAAQGGATQGDTGRSSQHTAGHGRGGQPFGASGQTAGRAQQLPPLTAQNIGQPQPLGLGRDLSHPPRGAGEIEGAPRQNVRPPGEGRPTREGRAPGQGQPHGLACAALALQHQRRQPGEGVKFGGEGPARAGAVPRILGRRGLKAGAGEDEAAVRSGLAGGRVGGPEVAGGGGETLNRAALQRQAVAGQTVQFDPQLAGQHPGDHGRPQAGACRGARCPDRRTHRRAAQAGDFTGRGRVSLGSGKATERVHADFSAWILAA